jgi:hypothetical protein
MNYYDWMESTITCRACGWFGVGRSAILKEAFNECAEYECPICRERVGVVAYPTNEENLANPLAAPIDRAASIWISNRLEQFKRNRLVAITQLPDLDPPPEILIWDVTGPASTGDVVIFSGEREIWREASWYENHQRFAEVALILQQKYGPALKDLIPTENSWLDLYGDSWGSVNVVESARSALAAK